MNQVESPSFTDWRSLLRLAAHALAGSGDLALMALGAALVALGVVVILDGFGIVDPRNLTDGTGAMLGSALVLAVFGGFALGVAVEGPIRTAIAEDGHPPIYRALFRAIGVAVVSAVIVVGVGYLEPLLADLPFPFILAQEALRAVGRAGLTIVLLVGVPVVFLVRQFWRDFSEDFELPILFVVWTIGAMWFLIRVL